MAIEEQWQKDLLEKLEGALNNAVTLEIVTAVGRVKRGAPATPEEGSLDLDWENNPVVALTKINLLAGDIKTVYPEEFVTGPFVDLKSFHAEREKQGHQILQGNLEAIRQLIKLVGEWINP